MKKLGIVTLFVSYGYCLCVGGCHVNNLVCETTPEASLHLCADYLSTGATCPANTQPASDTSCPTANVLGTCNEPDGLATVTYYADSGTTADQAQASCKDFGSTWTWKPQG
jgi:hypothetical protein